MRVLIYRVGSIGDTVVALPALHEVKRSYPKAHISLLTNFPITNTGKEAPLGAILDGAGIVDDYVEYPARKMGLRGIIDLRAKIRTLSPQILVYLMPVRNWRQLSRDWIFFRWCGINKISGLKFSKDAQSRRFITQTGIWEHEASRLARLITDDALAYSTAIAPDLRLSNHELGAADSAIEKLGNRPFFAVSVGSKVDVKDWGEERWLELISRLSLIYPAMGLVTIGSLDEFERCKNLCRIWEGDFLNLCGLLSPRASAAVLRRATLLLSHDSGPMHLSAAVGTPVVAIFAARNKPGEWFPIGTNHQVIYHKTDCFGCELSVCAKYAKKCITSIEPQEIISAISVIMKTVSVY